MVTFQHPLMKGRVLLFQGFHLRRKETECFEETLKVYGMRYPCGHGGKDGRVGGQCFHYLYIHVPCEGSAGIEPHPQVLLLASLGQHDLPYVRRGSSSVVWSKPNSRSRSNTLRA